MLPGFGRDWSTPCVNVFLIRRPEAVLASYAKRRGDFTLDEIGLPAQVDLFERAADRLGRAPPVIEGRDVLADPARRADRCCATPAASRSTRRCSPGRPGRRPATASGRPPGTTRSSAPPASRRRRAEAGFDDLDDSLKPLAEAARPLYERLARWKLTVRIAV